MSYRIPSLHFELCHHKWCNNRMKKTNGGPLNKFFLKILSFSVSLASNPTSEGCLEERVLMKACQTLCYRDREFWQVQFQIPNSTLAATLVFLPFRPLFRLSPPWPIYLSFFQQSLLLQLQQLSLKFFIFSSSPEKLFFFAKLQKRSPHAKCTLFI